VGPWGGRSETHKRTPIGKSGGDYTDAWRRRQGQGDGRVSEFETYRKLVLTFVSTTGDRGRVKDAKLTYTFEPMGNQTVLTRVVEAKMVGFWRLFQPLATRRIDKDSRQEAANIRRLFQGRPGP